MLLIEKYLLPRDAFALICTNRLLWNSFTPKIRYRLSVGITLKEAKWFKRNYGYTGTFTRKYNGLEELDRMITEEMAMYKI